jgi:glycosyltransferase involved in cell wall biosynthesis
MQHAEKLKIFFVLGFPNPFPRAGWTRIGFFAEDWSRKGHTVEVLGTFSYKASHKRGKKKMNNIHIFNLIFNMQFVHPLIFILNAFISFAVSTLILISRKPDVAIVSVPAGDVGVGALMACSLTRTKSIVDYRDEWEDYAISRSKSKTSKSFYLAIKKIVAGLYAKNLVVAVTPNLLNALKRRGLTSLKLVPNGADTKTFKPFANKRKSSSFLIFYSGGVSGYYRLDVAVKALKKLVDRGIRNAKLVIAGYGEVGKLLRLVCELGISENIEYKGVINDKLKLSMLIAEADAGLIPYDDNLLWKNALPAKFFEYCACGVPVIATVYEDSILAKLIKEHNLGIAVTPMDEEKLAEAIYKIYRDKSLREESGKRARILIEEKFDRNKISEEFLNLVKEIAQLKECR